MGWPVSIRNTQLLEDTLKNNAQIFLNDEAKHNSKIFYELLQYAPKILPEFSLLSDKQIKTIADSVAYLVRTDHLLLQNYFGVIPAFASQKSCPKIYGEDGLDVHLKNSPETLSPSFEIDKQYTELGAELFRCYNAAINWMGLTDTLDPVHHSLAPAFKLADMTAHLLTPTDLIDYHYTNEEIEQFNLRVLERSREI